MNIKGRYVAELMSAALADGKGIHIHVSTEGDVKIKAAGVVIARYGDVYEAIKDLLPEGYLEDVS